MALRGSPQRKVLIGTVAVAITAATIAFMPPALAQVASAVPSEPQAATPSDSLPNPVGDKYAAMREEAVSGVLSGKFTPEEKNGSTVVNVGKLNNKDQYVELENEGVDRIFVVLAEFGNTRHPDYPDQDTDGPLTPGPALFDGPLVNGIPQPDRTVDNSTVWRNDFSQSYFQDLYFGGPESLRDYYETQSSGRYSVAGTVTDWVRVTYNEARYGRSNGFPCTSIVCSNTWELINDAADQWVADQLGAGQTMAQVQAELATFDVRDRYDWDLDGNFNEPDGYLDHFQIVHAGGDQADGDPQYGEDAIWSHRWYTGQQGIGTQGPSPDFLIGGNEIGGTNFWIGDYTIQPENGGRSVFYHEYGHDLGLPDDYNILSGGDNNNEHWTLMAQSRLGAATDGGIGERGGDLGAWNKLQLGWLDYAAFAYNQKVTLKLGPQEYNTGNPQAAIMVLPQKTVVSNVGPPFAGSFQWYSGHANGVNRTLTRSVTLPAGAPSLTFRTRFDIEDCGPDPCDYAYVEVNSGTGFTPIAGTFTQAGEGNGIDGTQAAYALATFNLTAFAGQTVGLRFRYFTDGSVGGNTGAVPNGIFLDNIEISGGTFSDGAETLDPGWTVSGFERVGATASNLFSHYYIAGVRSYISYDQYLATGPYYFGYLNTLPDFVDHYNYQRGLLISYYDTSFADNDTGPFGHPGQGRNLYIDSHPTPMIREGSAFWRARIQVYDAPFSKSATDGMTLHQNSSERIVPSLPGNDTFRDTDTYWFASLPNHGVILPGYGVKIRVISEPFPEMHIQIN